MNLKVGYWREFTVKVVTDSTPVWFDKIEGEVFVELYKEGVFVCKIFLEISEIKENP
ncbi:MAG: hypothetical protein ACRCXZ_03805 [Patescibacteria group bacterium]